MFYVVFEVADIETLLKSDVNSVAVELTSIVAFALVVVVAVREVFLGGVVGLNFRPVGKL